MFVRYIVRQFEFMKGHSFGHPLLPGSRTVRVDVHSFGHFWIGLSSDHPTGVVKLVSEVISRDYVHQQDVPRFPVKAAAAHFKCWKHAPKRSKRHAALVTQSSKKTSSCVDV